jgi:uncharacterized protein with HEPN domain
VKDDRVYLAHILSSIQHIGEYSSAGKETFFATPMIQDAVVRNLEIIGEAVKHLSEPLKDRNPGIAWRRVAGMRDKMIHEYFGVNLVLVWEVVEKDLPSLQASLESIMRHFETQT